jgi:cytochrome c-type biogenesis protein CcmH/NrfG
MDKIAMLTEILSQNPADAFTRYGLAMAYASEGKNDDALREFATTTEHNPDYVPAAARTHNEHAASEMQAMLDDLA